jgi:hypothetical protein
MEIKTFDTILTGMCDAFDSLISPRSIARTNKNIVYLLFKAIAKGFEVINNICVVLSNKFDPENCSEEDLLSVASIVGTEFYKGSASGLHIIITNNNSEAVTLLQGEYYYSLDDDTSFMFEVNEEVSIEAGSYIDVIAMSEKIGSYPVTQQSSIDITSEQAIPDKVAFSCTDNSSLLGTSAETNLEFRKRILEQTDRQNTLVELETALKNLPYLFDCKLKFNDTYDDIEFDGYTIPPYSMIIFYSGSPRNEIAEKIAEYSIFPTVQTEDSKPVYFYDDVFTDGKYTAYINPFKKTNFSVNVQYKINNTFISDYDAKASIRTALTNAYVSEVHEDYVKEDDIYNIITGLSLSGIEILNVNLIVDGNAVDYVEVPLSRIPQLDEVTFTKVED